MDYSKIDLRDRLDLLDLPRKASDAVTRRDVDQYVSTYTEDAQWDPQPLFHVCNGRDEIRVGFLAAHETLEWAAQITWMTLIEAYDGSTAKTRSYIGEWGKPKGGEPAGCGIGMYTDICVKQDGVWLVQHHDLTSIYFGAPDWNTPFAPPTWPPPGMTL
ncbi:YybH family protein [Mycobacterium vicinigordonae]|uniref:Nuclear transport factor 2 family protein n=1 Tax=Mycobacterium vicinigordonae TaxID=1719132 RepID=A0A7D6DZV2_9MYCO|nr:nuclear transport factor 2 family protein [Mycobacterium vicinigordonae]QLL08724.1 nuclear transport factor 2 family protein [Mycobacterium vicinigordonae]